MSRTQTMVQLTAELVAGLDRRAAREGVSRSSVIREAVARFLADDHEAELDRRIVDGYTRVPQGGELEHEDWGDLGQAVTALAADQLRRLSAEERDAGFEPW